MKKMLLGFLYILIFNSACLIGMETVDKEHQNKSRNNDYAVYAELLHDRIDEEHLWVESTTPFRRFFGSFFSYIYSHCLTQEEIKDEMEQIESYIKLEDKEAVLNKLVEKHWYVYYLMQSLIAEKCKEIKKEFEAVKGSTIDTLHSFMGTQKSLESAVHNNALQLFYSQVGINRSLYQARSFSGEDDIHIAILYGHEHEIDPSSLVMSCDDNYLRSTDCEGNHIIWDMVEGAKADLADETLKNIKWTPGFWVSNKQYCTVNKAEQYCALNAKTMVKKGKNFSPEDEFFFDYISLDYIGNIPVKIRKNQPAIILFKASNESSFACQKVFNNCIYDRIELFSLKNSESFKNLTGFPKKKLERLLEQRHVSDKYSVNEYLVDKK